MPSNPLERDTEGECRQLDAKIAEKLFGFAWSEKDQSDFSNATHVLENAWRDIGNGAQCCRRIAERKADGRVVYFDFDHYSTDIAAAFLVVDAMQKYCCDFTLEKAGEAWYADFLVGYQRGSTPAQAICLAALAALESV